jgi:succinyl-CoA synthetase beta subunit
MIIDAKLAGLDHVYVASPDLGADELRLLHGHGISVSTDIRPLLLAMRCLSEHAEDSAARSGVVPAERVGAAVLPSGEGLVDEPTTKAWLRDLGFRVPSSHVFSGTLDAAPIAAFRRPLVMKGVSARIAHKWDHGLVELALRTDADLHAAWERIRAALRKADPASNEILVEEMIETGLEAIVGVQRDPVIGPVVVIGAGGILTELLDDAVVLVPPFGAESVRNALARIRFGRLLGGYRGRRYDVAALVDIAVRIGQVALNEPRLESLDINPVLVQPDDGGVVAVDGKLYLAR